MVAAAAPKPPENPPGSEGGVAVIVLALALLFNVPKVPNALVDDAGDNATLGWSAGLSGEEAPNPVAPNEDKPEPKADAPSFPALSPALACVGATAAGVCGCDAPLLVSGVAFDAAAAPVVVGGVPNDRGESFLAASAPLSESERLDADFEPKLKPLANGFAAGFSPTAVAGPES